MDIAEREIRDHNILHEYQIPHVMHLFKVASEKPVLVDTSDTGTGKTYTAIALCKLLRMRPLIIAPRNSHLNWQNIADAFDVEIEAIFSYEKLRTGSYNYCEGISTKNKYYNIETQEWSLPQYTLVIYDEAHRAKNGIHTTRRSTNNKILCAIRSELEYSESKLLLLSATLADRFDCYSTWLYLLGIIDYPEKFSQFADKIGTDNFFIKISNIIIPEYGGRMPTTVSQGYRNLILDISQDFIDNYKSEYNILDEEGDYSLQMRKLEIAKCLKLTENISVELSKCRSVICFVNYTESISCLRLQMRKHGIAMWENVIDGSVSQSQRSKIISDFQKDRLIFLICQIHTAAESISLHDIQGERKRSVFIMPTYHCIDVKQALGRAARSGSLSVPKMRIIYADTPFDDESRELKLKRRLEEKIKNIDTLNSVSPIL